MAWTRVIRWLLFASVWIAASASPQVVNGSQPAPRSRKFISATPGTTFSFSQIRNPHWKQHTISSTALYASGFLKHKRPMPPALQAAWNDYNSNEDGPSSKKKTRNTSDKSLDRRVNGQVLNTTNGLFVFPVRIGTPTQTLNLVLDTGSGDFWVWSFLMPAYILQGRNYYNASKSSSSAQWPGQSFGANYGSGSTYGIVYQDTIWIDGIGVGGNPIECTQNVAPFFAGLPGVDGILGISNAYNDSEKPDPQQTWLAYILPNLAAPVFTTSLVQNGIGSMDFGFINATKYTGSISYSPITIIPGSGGGFWAFNWTGFAVGNSAFNKTNIQVMTDTGGNIASLPTSITKKYYAQVAGAYQQSDGAWCFPCKSTLPNFTFGVGTGRIIVYGKHLTFTALADGINCYGAIQATGELDYVYMTIPFLESIFVVHDYGQKRMGFANRIS